MRRGFLLALALVLAAGLGGQWWLERPLPGNPALWEVRGARGERAFLFGTIHALPRAIDWKTPRVAAALAGSDRLVVEIAALNDNAAIAGAFAEMAHAPGQAPLLQRVSPELRPRLAALLARAGKSESDFADTRSWAAAVMLAQAAEGRATGFDGSRGVDRAMLTDPGMAVEELEGARAQLAIFASLPEADQRRMLAEVITSGAEARADATALAEAWRTGDIAAIARQTHEGMLADPVLRQALYVARNRRWADAIAGDIARGVHPFVAVGAAHMAGPEGLPVLLAARGFAIRRVE